MAKAKNKKTKSKSKSKSKAKSKKSAKPKSSTSKTVFSIAQITVPIAGTDQLFPVRRIYCIGRNYAAHAREMGSDPTREPPFFFQKPTDAIQVVMPGKVAYHPYSPLTNNYHYEIELVAALKSGGKNIKAADALKHVYGYAVGLDMTRRDLQIGMREQKKPWSLGKGFDNGAPVGPIYPVAKIGHPGARFDLAFCKRSGKTEIRSLQHDVERRGTNRKAFRGVRAEGGRHHHDRHARKCGRGGQGRYARRQGFRLAGLIDQDRLTRRQF